METNLREQEQVLGLTDTGRDINSVNLLLAKHKNAGNNIDSLGRQMDALETQGHALLQQGIPGSEPIPERIDETRRYFHRLQELGDARKNALEGALEYFQFFSEADDVEAYLLDTLRLVSRCVLYK